MGERDSEIGPVSPGPQPSTHLPPRHDGDGDGQTGRQRARRLRPSRVCTSQLYPRKFRFSNEVKKPRETLHAGEGARSSPANGQRQLHGMGARPIA